MADALILVLVFSLPVMQPFVKVGQYSIVLTDVMFVAAAAAFCLAVIRRGFLPRLNAWCWTLAAYGLAMTASAAASEAPGRSVVKLLGELYLLGMSVLVVDYIADEISLKRIVTAWLAGTAVTIVAAACGIALFLAGVRNPSTNIFLNPFGSLPPGPYPRVMALFQNANMMCTYAVASALVIIGARTMGWVAGRTSSMLLTGIIITAAFSLSPGLGGLFLALALWYRPRRHEDTKSSSLVAHVLRRALHVSWLWVAAAAFLFATLVSPPDALRGHWVPSSRVMTWQAAWNTFLSYPWFGRGLGLEVADVRYLNASGSLEILTDAHNTWLSILAQDGILGGLAFAAVTGWIVSRFKLFSPASSRLSELRVALEAAFAGGFLYQTLTGSFENTRHVWVLMAVVSSAQDLDDKARRTLASPMTLNLAGTV